LRYKCDKGYSIDGSVAEAKSKFHTGCTSDGIMEGMQTCQKISCGTPNTVPFTELVSPEPTSSMEFQEEAKYKCVTGYSIGGNKKGKKEFTVKCKANGVLTNPKVCSPVKCGKAPPIEHAKPGVSGDIFYGMDLFYRCTLGYTLDGNPGGKTDFDRTCQADGEFSPNPFGTTPPCRPITAGQAPHIGKAVLTEAAGIQMEAPMMDFDGGYGEMEIEHPEAFYPEGVEYHCLPGMSLDGTEGGATKIGAKVNAQGKFFPALPDTCVKITFTVRGAVKSARSGLMMNDVTVQATPRMSEGVSGGVSDAFGELYFKARRLNSTRAHRLNSTQGVSESVGTDNGIFSLDLAPGAYTLEYTHDSYITETREIVVEGNIFGGPADVTMAPKMKDDEWRAVLKWGKKPRDLDTYAMWGWTKVYYGRKTQSSSGMTGVLEQDIASGKGPETFFLSDVGKCKGSAAMCHVRYFVKDMQGDMLDIGGASVTVYTGDREVGTWKLEDSKPSVVKHGRSLWWHVFTIDGRSNSMFWSCDQPPYIPTLPGLVEKIYDFKQGEAVPGLMGRVPTVEQSAYSVNHPSTKGWKNLKSKKDFAARWDGSIRIHNGGTYKFELESSDGSKLWVGEKMVVNNGGVHKTTSDSKEIKLSDGLHAIRIDFFKRKSEGDAGVVFKWEGPDCNCDKMVPVPTSALRQNIVTEGLTEEAFYFDQGKKIPDLSGMSPNLARAVDTVNYKGTSGAFSGFARKDNFATRWTGFVEIHVPGKYKFFIESDDGSRMIITTGPGKKKTLIDNDGLHGMKEKGGEIFLKTQVHAIKLKQFERGGGAGMIFRWKGADSGDKKELVPKKVLRKVAGLPPVADPNAGLREEAFYFKQSKKLGRLRGRVPNKFRVVDFVNYPSTSGTFKGLSKKDDFSIRWSGSLVINNAGSYETSITSDDGSKLYMQGDQVINNDGLHGMKTKKHGFSAEKGARSIRLEMFERGGGAGCIFKYKGKDTGGNWRVVPKRATKQSSTMRGLFREVFHTGKHKNLPNLVGKNPNQIGADLTVNYKSSSGAWKGFSGRKDRFAVRWTGFIHVKDGSNYKFYLKSDDGSKMWLDGKQVIDNNGLHGMRERSCDTKFDDHSFKDLRIEMFENGGGAGCEFRYKGADTKSKKEIVGHIAGSLRRMAGN
jgi:hypothetical protein